ncbi:unnamed protein product [Cylindrotheca closterium]|uniref:Glutaminase n=1 Tax=Cylindrotheca closterium TaxID=2856 RepID=A0AAD2FWQ6_9STRA|nr:unnamed protein product [Cylindrotheca closterium]
MMTSTRTISTLKRIVSNNDVVLPAAKKAKRSLAPESRPSQLVREMFQDCGACKEQIVAQAQHKFITPTTEMIAAYTMDASKAVRDNNIEKLRELHASGAPLNCCNKFGDSLLNIACRRSHTQIVKFLLEEVKVEVYMKDDTGRIALHDACWTSSPNFEIVELLLKAAPDLALMPDHRGHTPFEYTRSGDWAKWCDFLAQRKSLFQQ